MPVLIKKTKLFTNMNQLTSNAACFFSFSKRYFIFKKNNNKLTTAVSPLMSFLNLFLTQYVLSQNRIFYSLVIKLITAFVITSLLETPAGRWMYEAIKLPVVRFFKIRFFSNFLCLKKKCCFVSTGRSEELAIYSLTVNYVCFSEKHDGIKRELLPQITIYCIHKWWNKRQCWEDIWFTQISFVKVQCEVPNILWLNLTPNYVYGFS